MHIFDYTLKERIKYMREKEGDTRKEVEQINSNRNKEEARISDRAKPNSMPNPVKGLTLSLYPMIKEH